MSKFRKKPVVIDAFQFNGLDGADMSPKTVDFFGDNYAEIAHVHDGQLVIKTLEGDMLVSPGDFIIKGVEGEFYPCKASIFEKTYDVAESTEVEETEE